MKASQYGFAKISEKGVSLLKSHVSGKKVLDVGCGDLSLAKFCKSLGAETVVGLDSKNPLGYRAQIPLPDGVRFIEKYFAEYLPDTEPLDVAIVSWPANHDFVSLDIAKIVSAIPKVIYIGYNDGVTQCGTPLLWQYLTKRNLVALLESPSYPKEPDPDFIWFDTILVYGDESRSSAKCRTPNQKYDSHLVREEIEGLDLNR